MRLGDIKEVEYIGMDEGEEEYAREVINKTGVDIKNEAFPEPKIKVKPEEIVKSTGIVALGIYPSKEIPFDKVDVESSGSVKEVEARQEGRVDIYEEFDNSLLSCLRVYLNPE
ncbi:MAG: hypothetical protein ACLFTQ_00155 [Candidatus Aenigmatarchaeota archaeon]